MDWALIAVLGLAVWVWLQSQRIAALRRELSALGARVVAMSAPPLLLDTPLRAGEDEPLVLDTPIPEASNDSGPAQSAAFAREAPNSSAEALAALTMLAALAAPLAGIELRPAGASTLYIGIIAVAGFTFAATMRWVWVALAAFAGLAGWFYAAIIAGDVSRALAAAGIAALGGVSLAFRASTDSGASGLTWSRLRADAPSIAIAASSVLLIWCWLAVAELQDAGVARLAWVGAMLVALAAAAVRARVAAPASFAVAVVSLVVGFVFFIGIRFQFPPLGDDFYAAALACAALIALAALWAKPHRWSRVLVAVAGATGAGVLVALAATTRDDWHGPEAWGALFAGGAALLACATRQDSNAVTPWVAAGALLMMLGVESASPELWRGAAYAGVAVALAIVFAVRRWPAAGVTALVAGGVAVAHLLFGFDALAPDAAFATTTLTAVLLFAAGRAADDAAPRSTPGDGLTLASAIAILLTLFLALRASGVDVSRQIVLLVLGLAAGAVALRRLRRSPLAKPASPSTSSA
ncbi:MAG: hypothetical protein K2P58_07390 [Hyphomonadaceae bacterium]|nr:hypothetical protein [Hyphomonadaceae bacterium]